MNLKRIPAGCLIVVTLLFLNWVIYAPDAMAGGFSVFTHNAGALAQANAVTAHNDSPSTVFFNPALLNTLDGTQIEIGSTLISPDRRFTSAATGRQTDGDDDFHFPTTLFVSHTISDSLSAGFGITNPFGLGSDWPDEWEGRFITTKSQLSTFNFNPVLSWRVHPSLSIAAGVDYLYLDATLESRRRVGLLEGKQKFSGDGTAWGFNLALAFEPDPDWTVGVSYRSRFKVDADGDLTVELPGFPLQRYNGSTQITLPSQITAGLAWKAHPRLTLEIGFRWEEWSTFNELHLKLENAPVDDPVIPRDWHDSYGFNVGAEYRMSDRWALLGGYMFEKNPVPDETFEAGIPDSDTHLFSFGAKYQFNRWMLAAGYALQLETDRDKNNRIGTPLNANGQYEALLHMLAISLTFRY
ncbi:MAG: outer membrane protein transport protein [Deltaproteobacteria bacterium]|nr:outer membrane protein transport protein [Deltaproteobacteria bacterium]